MYRTTLAILPVLLGASAASADTFTIQPPQFQLVLLPYPHSLHSVCHQSDWYTHVDHPECATIRQQEKTAGENYAKTSTTTFIDNSGTYRTGRRDIYDQTKVKGTTSEASFLAASALKRFTPPSLRGASSRPEFDATDKPLIDSCDEYVYKRYYTVNRYLDTIGGYLTARNYDSAVYAILYGLPSVVQATNVQPRACAPLENSQFKDFDGNVTSPFTLGPTLAPFDAFKPQHTGSQLKNEFFGLSDLVAPPPAGYIDPNPAHGGTYWSDFTAAYNASQVNPFVDDGADGEFKRASTGRIAQLFNPPPLAEVEDIAVRRIAMRKATAIVGHKYSVCLMKRMRDLTATANLGPGTWQNLEQYVADPQQGWTDPVDLDEVALQIQLFNSSYANTALTTVLGADTKSLLQSGAWARSKTGSLLRAMAKIDQNALATAVGTTAYSIKQKLPTGCDINDELDAVRDLVVAEWRLPGHGCYSGSKCDYNSVMFTGDINSRLQSYTYGEDEAKRLCTGTTSDDWVYGAATVDPIYRGTLATLEQYLRDQHNKLLKILLNTPTESNLPGSIGDVRGGGSDWGNGTFGAGYSYRGEWAVNVSSKGTTTNPLGQTVSCSVLGGRVDGSLNAYATGFGYRKDLIDAALTAKTKQGLMPATLSAHANILGIDLFTPIENQTLPSSYTAGESKTQSFTLATAYVTVGPFPVKVSVEVGFDWGYNMNFSYTQSACSQKPTLGVSGELAPYAGTNASVSAGIDLFVVGAGVKFTLTLVSAKLPFDASVTVGPNAADNNNWSVTAKSNLVLDLTELAGKVSLYITSFGITLMEFELFSWPGLHQKIDLWHDEAVFPFSGFSLLN